MTRGSADQLNDLWSRHNAEWRDPAQIASHWQEAAETDPRLLEHKVEGAWWDVVASSGITLLVTREYEHLIMAVRVGPAGPLVSYMRIPHPSGLVVDRSRRVVHVASTRNPNQVFDLMPVTGLLSRRDTQVEPLAGRPLVPVRSRFLPGCLYLHELAIIGEDLYGNAVGQNAIVRLDPDGRYERVWWPRCVEARTGPVFERNHIQLNSIAAGDDLAGSYFSASTDRLSSRRPGHRNFGVRKRGVIFSGQTRQPIVRGLTRPHSARLFRGRIWVANSGYGELGVVDGGHYVSVTGLPGWTRGLCFSQRTAFVGTSRVIPRFARYAPGLDPESSICGVHAVDSGSGRILGSLIWPHGHQIFAVEWIPGQLASGFPFHVGSRRMNRREKTLFYAFAVSLSNGDRA